jgi:hypothetical protein
MYVARQELEQKSEMVLEEYHVLRGTYLINAIHKEYAVVDLNISTIGKNSSALTVACPPPGIGAKQSRKL